MSARRLGRLLGSLLVLAALAGGLVATDLRSVDGGFQQSDIVWNMSDLRGVTTPLR